MIILKIYEQYNVINECYYDLMKCSQFIFPGVHLTGMYLNPLNATNQHFGCDGISAAEHITIYWIGPLLASAVATRSYDLVATDKPTTSKRKASTSNNNVVKNGKESTEKNGRSKVKNSSEVADDWTFVNSDDKESKTSTVTKRSLRNREVLIAD